MQFILIIRVTLEGCQGTERLSEKGSSTGTEAVPSLGTDLACFKDPELIGELDGRPKRRAVIDYEGCRPWYTRCDGGSHRLCQGSKESASTHSGPASGQP